MTLNEYQFDAARTINPMLTRQQMLHHALFEISSEVGEVHGIFQKELQGHPIDKDDLKSEIGDILWGICELCQVYGWSLNDVAQHNVDKLMKRYPDGFDSERSAHRPEYEGGAKNG